MKIYTLILFFLAFNAAGYIIANLVGLGVLTGNSSVMPYTLDQVNSQFSLFTFSTQNVAYGIVGAGIAGLVGWLTKQGMFAVIAALIWVVGVFLNIFNWILNGFPVMLNILLAGTGLEFMAYVAESFVLVFFFFFLASILSQRQDLT
jgi:apolipoprotein N-acyltransferase